MGETPLTLRDAKKRVEQVAKGKPQVSISTTIPKDVAEKAERQIQRYEAFVKKSSQEVNRSKVIDGLYRFLAILNDTEIPLNREALRKYDPDFEHLVWAYTCYLFMRSPILVGHYLTEEEIEEIKRSLGRASKQTGKPR